MSVYWSVAVELGVYKVSGRKTYANPWDWSLSPTNTNSCSRLKIIPKKIIIYICKNQAVKVSYQVSNVCNSGVQGKTSNMMIHHLLMH